MASVKHQIRIGLLIMPAGIGIQLLAFLLIANHLGPKDFGVYSVIFAIMTIFTLATEMGIGTIVIKAVAEEHEVARDYIAIAWPVIALASLIAAVLQIAVVFSFYSVAEIWAATLMACLNVLVFGLSMVLSCVLRGLGRVEQWYAGFFSQKLLALLMILGFLRPTDLGIGFAMAVWPLSSIIVLLYYVRCLWGEDWGGELRWSPRELKDLVMRSIPVGLTAAAYRLSSQIEVFILAAFAGSAEVGLYVIGQRLLNPAGSILNGAVVMPTFPGLCKLASDRSPELGRWASRLGIIHWLAAMGIAIGVWALAPILIPLLLDPDFNDSIWVVQITIWALGPYLISLQLRYLYVALSAQNRFLHLTLAYLLLKLVLMAMLTSGYGLLGACIGMLISESLLALLARFGLGGLGLRLRLAGAFTGITFAAALLVVLCAWLGISSWPSLSLVFLYLTVSLFLFNHMIRGVRKMPTGKPQRTVAALE